MTRLDEAPLWPAIALAGFGFLLLATPRTIPWLLQLIAARADARVCAFANDTDDDMKGEDS